MKTEPDGLSFLLIDMTSPGVSVRPIPSIDYAHHLNEVFLDNVATPVWRRIGEEGQGREIARFLLGLERQAAEMVTIFKHRLGKMRERVSSSCDPLLKTRFAHMEISLEALQSVVHQMASERSNQIDIARVGSLNVLSATLEQKLTELCVQLYGLGALEQPPMDDGLAEIIQMTEAQGCNVDDAFFKGRFHLRRHQRDPKGSGVLCAEQACVVPSAVTYLGRYIG